MKERPILFSAPMVRALLAGTKTQTRRIAKPVRHPDLGNVYAPGALVLEHEPQHVIDRCCPYGRPGDRLWVRETHNTHGGLATYRADGDWIADYHREEPQQPRLRWVPAIHMPRTASRITLEITGTRVERLQDISEEDAKAEGAPGYEEGLDAPPPDGDHEWSYRASFQRLWEQINGPGAWAKNPWVWVVEFERAQAQQKGPAS